MNRINVLRKRRINTSVKKQQQNQDLSQEKGIIINKMLKQIKILLSKSILLHQIQSQSQKLCQFPLEEIEKYRWYQKKIQLNYFNQTSFDKNLYGIFAYRLLKQLNFWTNHRNSNCQIIKQIQRIILQQKAFMQQNIVSLYLQALSLILLNNNRFIQKIHKKIQEQQMQDKINEMQQEKNELKSQKIVAYRNLLESQTMKIMNNLFHGMGDELELKHNEIIRKFKDSESKSYNMSHFLKKQIKRNNKVRSEMIKYDKKHEHHKQHYKQHLKNIKYTQSIQKQSSSKKFTTKDLGKTLSQNNKFALPIITKNTINQQKDHISQEKSKKRLQNKKQIEKIKKESPEYSLSLKVKFILNKQINNPNHFKLRL